MKTARILTIVLLALGVIFSLAKVSKAAPLGTAFTYQGHLYDTNSIANGLYDFQFKLYDDPNVVIGQQIGSDVNQPDVDVIDGYFTVELDFGSGVFDGNDRWLEIGVRPGDQNDPNVYTPLSPLQEITPTPYAFSAANVSGVVPVSNGGTGITTGPTAAGQYLRASGSGTWSVGSIEPNDLGNLYYLNAADGSPTNALYVDNVGNVGIGTVNPLEILDVNGNIKADGLTYSAVQTRHFAVPSVAFGATSPAANFIRNNGFIMGNTAGQFVAFLAPIYLPDGATIVGYKARINDSSSVRDFTIRLMRQFATGGSLIMTSSTLTSSGSSGGTTLVSPALSESIDSANEAYLIETSWITPATVADIQLFHVNISYTVDNPLP